MDIPTANLSLTQWSLPRARSPCSTPASDSCPCRTVHCCWWAPVGRATASSADDCSGVRVERACARWCASTVPRPPEPPQSVAAPAGRTLWATPTPANNPAHFINKTYYILWLQIEASQQCNVIALYHIKFTATSMGMNINSFQKLKAEELDWLV